jgi:hypothetical protein
MTSIREFSHSVAENLAGFCHFGVIMEFVKQRWVVYAVGIQVATAKNGKNSLKI